MTRSRDLRVHGILLALCLVASAAPAQNLVVNGDFDVDLSEWINLDFTKEWSSLDAANDPASGSMVITNTGSGPVGYYVEQCVPLAGGGDFEVRYAHYSTGTNTTGRADFALYWYTNALCNGVSSGFEPIGYSEAVDAWTSISKTVSAPPSAVAALLHPSAWKSTGADGEPWVVHFDQIYLPEPGGLAVPLVAAAALGCVARRKERIRASDPSPDRPQEATS